MDSYYEDWDILIFRGRTIFDNRRGSDVSIGNP